MFLLFSRIIFEQLFCDDFFSMYWQMHLHMFLNCNMLFIIRIFMYMLVCVIL